MSYLTAFIKQLIYYLNDKLFIIIASVVVASVLFALRGKITSWIVKPISKNLTESEKLTVEKTTKFLVNFTIIIIDIILIIIAFGQRIISSTFVVPFITIVGEKILGVAIILIVTCILYGLRKKFISKLLSFTSKASDAKKATLEQVLSRVLAILIIGLASIQLFILFGTDPTTILAFTGAISVAFGLAAKDLVNDFLSGSIFIVEDQFHLGDVITANDITGAVVDVNLRTLVLRSADGNMHTIPNGSITIITNHTREFSKATVVVGVSYNSDVDFVIDVLKDEMAIALTELDSIIEVPDVHGIIAFGESSISMRIVATCAPGEHWKIERELRRRIKVRFDKENIEIPFPQRVVTINKEQ